jgi:SAM-dependent methyltransferase
LELNLSQREDLYPRLLARLRAGDTFLDVGCCLGQDIRKLVFDGVPGENLTGAELNQGFLDLGYELFCDADTLQATFLNANILEEGGILLGGYRGKFDVVQLGMILHLFSWEEQVKVFEHTIKLLKPDKPGTSIIGQATGHLDGISSLGWTKDSFKHNVESFKHLVAEVESTTGTRWEVKAELDTGLSIFDGKRTWDNLERGACYSKLQRRHDEGSPGNRRRSRLWERGSGARVTLGSEREHEDLQFVSDLVELLP